MFPRSVVVSLREYPSPLNFASPIPQMWNTQYQLEFSGDSISSKTSKEFEVFVKGAPEVIKSICLTETRKLKNFTFFLIN